MNVLAPFLLAIWFTAIGLVILRRARGMRRRANEQCVFCGYDMPGHASRDAETANGETDRRCPECGRIPKKWPAKESDRLRKDARWQRISAGILLVTALIGLGGSIYLFWNGWVISARGRPVWLLRIDAMDDDRDALSELQNRIRAERVSDANARRILADAWEVQANPDRPWESWEHVAWRCLQQLKTTAPIPSNYLQIAWSPVGDPLIEMPADHRIRISIPMRWRGVPYKNDLAPHTEEVIFHTCLFIERISIGTDVWNDLDPVCLRNATLRRDGTGTSYVVEVDAPGGLTVEELTARRIEIDARFEWQPRFGVSFSRGLITAWEWTYSSEE